MNNPCPTTPREWLATQHDAMLALLEQIVNIDSGSYNPSGVDAVGRKLEAFFALHGLTVEWHRGEDGGDAFSVRVRGATTQSGPILLMGHRDTVFPAGEAANRPFKIEGDRAYGPGVADMKAGLVMNAFVLVAYHKHGALACPLVALFTTDEEIGSPRSRAIIKRTALGARAVFNAEPARPNGNVVTGRKGGTFLKLTVRGKAAHSGGNFAEGISAIAELANKIAALQTITDIERGITLNVGVIRGGQSVNTVADWAEAFIDLRYRSQHHRSTALAIIHGIVESSSVAGTRSSVEIEGEFDAFVPSEESSALFLIYQEAMAELGIAIEGEFSGGCADSGITSELGCPTVCAVGPVGGKVHTPDEFLEYWSIAPRAQGLIAAIERVAAGTLPLAESIVGASSNSAAST